MTYRAPSKYQAVLLDEKGNTVVYLPYAIVVQENENFLILKAQGESGVYDELLILRTISFENGGQFELVDDNDMIAKVVGESLGESLQGLIQ